MKRTVTEFLNSSYWDKYCLCIYIFYSISNYQYNAYG